MAIRSARRQNSHGGEVMMKLRIMAVLIAVGLTVIGSLLLKSKALSKETENQNLSISEQVEAPKSRIGVTGVMAFIVKGVVPGSPSEQAGLREGDIVTSINGVQIDSISDFQQQVAQSDPGTTFEITRLKYDAAGKSTETKLKVKSVSSEAVYK